MTPRPCSTCTEPGAYDVGTRGYCVHHFGELLATFDPANIPGTRAFGFAASCTPRPDVGFAVCDLTCCRCGATWPGVPGEPCGFCYGGHATLAEAQARLLLDPPPNGWSQSWGERLGRGVLAGLITPEQAHRAIRRASRIGAT